MHFVPSKIDAENNFCHFLAIFALFKLQKGIIFGIFILDMLPKLLLDALNIHVIYLGKKDLFSFSFFYLFLLILKDIPNSSIFRPILIYNFFFNFH